MSFSSRNEKASNYVEAFKCLILQGFVWCRHQESNSGPTDYKSVALPTELYRQRTRSMICMRGFFVNIIRYKKQTLWSAFCTIIVNSFPAVFSRASCPEISILLFWSCLTRSGVLPGLHPASIHFLQPVFLTSKLSALSAPCGVRVFLILTSSA